MVKPAAESYYQELEQMGVNTEELKGRLTDSELAGLVNGLHKLLRTKHARLTDAEAE